MKAIAKRAKGFFVGTLLAALVFSSCGGFFDDVSAADSSPTYAPSAAGNSAPISYAISIDQSIEHGSVAASTASANPASKAVEGETVTLAASPADGYALASLTYTPKGGSPINVGGNGNSRTFAMPKSDVSVSAEFTAIAYSVNVADSITGGTVSATPTNANAGQTISLTAAAGAGWKLKAWDVKDEAGNPVTVANNAFDMPNGNVSVSAVFVKIDYSITISDTTNGRVSADKTTANYGDAVTLTITLADGYTLAALTYALRGEEPVNVTGSGSRRSFEMPAGDVTVAATFTPVAFSVNVADSITGGRISATPTNANVGQTISLTAAADTGWKLKAWNVVAQGGGTVTVANNKFTMPAKNVSVSATFEKINYSITISDTVNGTVSADKTAANYGDTVTLTARPSDGYALETLAYTPQGGSAVSMEGSGNTRTFAMPAANVTVAAAFSPIAFSVNVADSITGGRIAASSTNANVGDVITLVPTANTGWQFKAWNVVAEGGAVVTVTENQFTMPAKSVSVSAAFEKIDYSITVEEAENGSARADKTTANYGDTVTLDLAAKDGYEFESVSVKDSDGHEVGTSALLDGKKYKFTMPAQNVTVTATFTAINYAVNIGTFERGTVEASATSASVGTSVTLTVKPGTGCKLDALTVKDASGSTLETSASGDKIIFAMPAKSVTVSATFVAINYTVSIGCYDHGTVEADKTTANYGDTVTLTARPDDGYALETLTYTPQGGSAISVGGSGNTRTFTMPAKNVTVSATFVAINYTVNIGSCDHGTVTADKATANYGDTVTLTIRPDDGYDLDTLTVKDASGATLETSVTGGSRTFTMPASNVTVSATFVAANYTVHIGSYDHGTVEASTTSAAVGTNVTLTIRPDDGYKLGSLTVKDTSGAKVSTIGTGNTRAFMMPEKNVIVEATFVIISALDIPLTLEAIEADTIVTFWNNAPKAKPLTYKVNGGSVQRFRSNIEKITLNAVGDKVEFYGDNASYKEMEQTSASNISCNKKCYVYGNIMSLVKSEGFASAVELKERFTFYGLFQSNKFIMNKPDVELVLPATKLAASCYEWMFKGCTSLTSAPELPATTLKDCCYESMFEGCTGLTSAPALPATKLSGSCYERMFKGCTSLTTAPELPATEVSGDCYRGMFEGCTSLTSAPEELPATSLGHSYNISECYAWMFSGCTSLTKAPKLPATTLSRSCYQSMFSGCTSLTSAPELPATSLWEKCYQSMFLGCTSLTKAPKLPATNMEWYCYRYMFNGCTSLTSAPELPATTLKDYCYESMFEGCTSLTSAPELPATTLKDYCYESMFEGCTSLTSAPGLPATKLYTSCYESMFSGCTSLTSAPELPATTLVKGCYGGMFSGCANLKNITCLATDISAEECVKNWLNGVASKGTFKKAADMAEWSIGSSGIPEGWTFKDYEQ